MVQGSLHLIPNRISDDRGKDDISPSLLKLICGLRFWVVENLRSTRRYLKSLDNFIEIDKMNFLEMNKRVDVSESLEAIKWLKAGQDVGVMSDSGLPGIADPGNVLILKAHKENIPVIPHAGPSSMLLGLIASGLNGQRFMFHGYLPVKSHDRNQAVKKLEKQSIRDKASQIIMETPYRNERLFDSLVSNLHGNSWLTVACDIDATDAFIRTLRVKTWKKAPQLNLHKRPAVFVLQGFDE
ncbi:MAG: SAM-dependent methyltransferase [Bacteroidota bacterium]|nr:SAM-dependent methyltransferase [Bacteroidota bacterium]